MPIRIMHVVEAFGVGGGVENGIANLIGRMDAARYEHILCAVTRIGAQTERYPQDCVSVVCLGEKAARRRSQFWPLARIVREARPDIVHSRNWGAIEAVLAARWVGGCAAIHSEHGVEVNPAAEPARRTWLRRACFEAAHRVFSVSHLWGGELTRRTGFSPNKMRIIHNGVDSDRFRPDPRARHAFRAELGIGDSEFLVGCVGRLSPIKDYPTLFRALELFTAACPTWRLAIAGEGAERKALEESAAADPALRGRIRFLGSSSRIPELLAAVDTYVLPSLFEGISNSLLEAMASSAPAVATDVGGNPEVIVDGESGLLFPVGDAAALAGRLTLLVLHNERRVAIGRAARRRVYAEFSLDSMVREYELMYNELSEKRSGKRNAEAQLACGRVD